MHSPTASSRISFVLLLLLLTFTAAASYAEVPDTLVRDEIPDKYKWDFSDIYPGWDAWEADLAKLEALMDEFPKLKGTLSEGPQQLLKAATMGDELGMLANTVYRYPGLMMAVDARNTEVAAKLQSVQILFQRFGTAMAWYNPEVLEIPYDTVAGWIDATPALEIHRFGLEDLFRQQTHVLSEDKEELLSYFSPVNNTAGNVYTELSTSDIEFPEVTLPSGETVTMSPGTYYGILEKNRSQADRKAAFEAFYGVFEQNANTYAAIYNGILQSDWASAQARNYDSCVGAALDGNNIPVSVYENLVDVARENPGPVHRFNALRKKVLGLDEYHNYDSSVPLVDFDKSYPFDDIKDWIVASVEPLGKSYTKKMDEAFSSGWVDVYENEGKRSGAFSAGVYGVHPFMLLNYNETMDSFFTTAHEMGHTLHTMLSNETQPYTTSGYTIFVAEVASTLNEALLLDYMLDKTDDPLEKAALLTHAIDDIIGTFYTQVMFADYELQAHRLVEEGQPITKDVLKDLYGGLLTTQLGPAVTGDDLYTYAWTRISHFYNVPFYVYQYATCYASSAQIYKELTTGDKKSRQATLDRYMTLLKSGGNDHPMEQLRKAGVDLGTPAPFQAVVDHLDELVTQLEVELDKL